MWYALLIPIILSIFSYLYFSERITFFELIIPTVISFLAILISYFTLKEVNMSDIEYNGQLIIEARYYESYSTWVEETCSYTTTCCCDSKGENCQTQTHYYDCSYCRNVDARWVAIDDKGKEISISQEKYNYLLKKWSTIPRFVELNRRIEYHNGCGKDGDMYYIRWNWKPETSEAEVSTVTFRNPVKVSHSAFKYATISDKEADTFGLYRYPDFYDDYKQRCLLSKDFTFSEIEHTKLEFLNGYLGPRNKVKIFTLIFKNKPIDIAFKQEQYWQNGNQNEFVTCIGVNDTLGITWIKPFSWCDNKRVIVDTREDIFRNKKLNIDSIYEVYNKNIPLFFHYKSFKDFNYLKFEPTNGQCAFVYIITLIVSIVSIIITIKNDINP